jgi:hypothetical protein
VLSYADRLRRAGDDDSHSNHTSITPQLLGSGTAQYPYSDYQFAFPINLSLFTLNQPSLAKDQHIIYLLLCDLHNILAIAANRQIAPLSHSVYEYVVFQYDQLLPYITDQDHIHTDISTLVPGPTSLDANDLCIAPLRLSIFILTSFLFSSHDEEGAHQTQNLANLVSRLRALLSSTVSGIHINTNWAPFLGALVWCHAIGLRFAGPQFDRTWFMMHFLRVAQLSALESWEETSRSIEVIVCTLERIGRVSVGLREVAK